MYICILTIWLYLMFQQKCSFQYLYNYEYNSFHLYLLLLHNIWLMKIIKFSIENYFLYNSIVQHQHVDAHQWYVIIIGTGKSHDAQICYMLIAFAIYAGVYWSVYGHTVVYGVYSILITIFIKKMRIREKNIHFIGIRLINVE